MSSKPIAILLAGLAGGAADILTAFVIYRPASPIVILQSVASGWLGKASFKGGLPAAGLGLVSHFAIAVLFAAIFVLAAGQAPVLLKKPLISGPVFGICVYGIMNAVVVPLSQAPERHTPPAMMIGLGLLAHVLFGLALAFTASRMLGGAEA
jgi:uncharacterized membrane protein YagU involved in acid resistance